MTLHSTNRLAYTPVLLFVSVLIAACGDQKEISKAQPETDIESHSTATENDKNIKPTVKDTTLSEPETLAQTTVEATPDKATAPVNIVKQNVEYRVGTHYDVISEPMPVTTGDKIQVSELFWYGCPHCFSLEPHLLDWQQKKPANAEFYEIPAVFGSQWGFHAQAFYTIKALGIKEQAHQEIFNAIHLQKKQVNTFDQLVTLLEKFGKDRHAIETAFNSFSVDNNLRNATLMSSKSGANSVPAIIIDGKYRTSVSQAGGYQQLMALMNYLINKAQAEREG
ncbi:MAG: thiol:disulfide interchange protein DsbA/DsbL [Arenicella sp.]